MEGIELNFMSNVFPQLISLVLIVFYYFRYIQLELNNLSMMRIGAALGALLYGKAALFLAWQVPVIVKVMITSSLVLFFVVMIAELGYRGRYSYKIQMYLIIIMAIFLSVSYDPYIESRYQSIGIVLADLLLFYTSLKCSFQGLRYMQVSWLMFTAIHLIVATTGLGNEATRIIYAWGELPAQMMFLIGVERYLKQIYYKRSDR